MGEAPREVSKEAFRHRPEQPFDVVGKVLVMVFLESCEHEKMGVQQRKPTLFRNARSRSCTDLPSYFLNLPRFSMNNLSSRDCQSFPTTWDAPVSSVIRLTSRGSLHMISKRSEASCRNVNRFPGSQKYGWSKHEVVSGLEHTHVSMQVSNRE